MPDFRTAYEQKKWNEISGMEKAALSRMASGEATVDDLRAVQGLIANYQSLVTSTFRSGLRALSITAEQRVQKIVDHRESLGKPPLDEEQFNRLLSLALDKAWFDQGPELAVLIESELEKSRTTQNKDFESLLEEKLTQHRPKSPEEDDERLKELGDAVSRAWADDDQPSTVLGKSLADHQDDPDEGMLNIPLSEKLINEANESAQITRDIADELADITNEDKREEREDSKIKRWWRALKDKMPSVKGKARGVMTGLAVLLGKLLVTELMGGKLWSRIQEFFAWDNIKKIGSELADFGSSLMDRGWKALESYLSFEKINKLFKESLASGLDGLGSMGTAIKSFFGLGEEEPPPPPVLVPGPGQVAQSIASAAPVYGPEVPDVGPGGDVRPLPTAQPGPTVASGSWQDDALPVQSASIPGPGKESITPEVAPEPPKVNDPNPAAESTLVEDLAAKGAAKLPEAPTSPEAKQMDLGNQKQNEIPDPQKEEEGSTGGQVPGGKAKGGVHSTMSGFSRGVSVDGTLTIMNFGMLTN